jgi:hypothetical protein
MSTHSPQELLAKFDLHPPSTAPGRYYVTCPKCAANRSTKAHREAKCLGITIDDKGTRWGCSHCSWTGPPKSNGQGGDIVATYDFLNEAGELLFQKVRKIPKDFLLRRPDGHCGWIWNIKGVRKVIYRLPEVIEAIASELTVLCVEGEKDANNLWSIGVPATCNPDGASEPNKNPKWLNEYSELLRGADIVVIPDNDPSGHAHAEATAKMSRGVAKRVRYLDLAKHWPECPKGGDVSDWLAAGHTREELDALIDAAPLWEGEANNCQLGGNGKDQQPADWWRAELIDPRDLCEQKFPEIRYVVPDLFPEGVTLLASRPKIGKSWLLLQVGTAISFDRETCRWMILGEAADVRRSRERARVLAALKGAGDGLTVMELVNAASLVSRNAADSLLFDMHKAGEIERLKRGLYALPGTLAKIRSKVSDSSKKARPARTPSKNQEDTNLAEIDECDGPARNATSLKNRDDSHQSAFLAALRIPGSDAPPADDGYPELPDFLDRRGRP